MLVYVIFMMGLAFLRDFKTWSKMIKLEHTLFSLPFVMSSALLSHKYLLDQDSSHQSNWWSFLWIALCILGARGGGMTLNRIIDADIDAKNPRTAERAIPSGKISFTSSWIYTVISILILVFAAFQLPRLCQWLLPVPILFVWAYPYIKRISFLCHFFLGTILAGATLGGWIAISGSFNSVAPFYLSLAVLAWTAAFDIIYATQDIDYDRAAELQSIPSVLGFDNSIKLVKFLHILTLFSLYYFGYVLALGLLYKIGVVVVMLMLLYEHKLVKDAKVEMAFFAVNSWISVIYLVFIISGLIFKM